MALIGTISGSNGTSITAISGSLIIADEPATRFPALTSGVKLFVSGAKSSVGADAPAVVFGGDTFVSGALGTDSYFQMKPVNTLRIPTNQTASYIYTSGSTNDMYFSQYQPGTDYTSTTRLRWLEGMLTTGLLYGGVLSTASGSTTFSITSGSGIIISYNASTASDPYPTINFITWPTTVSQSLNYVTSSQITYVGINPTGGIIQQTSSFSISSDSDFITIGRILHQSGSVTNGTITQPIVSYGTNHWQDDFTRAFGPLKVSGHVLAASGSTLSLTKTAGDSYVVGRNYTTNPNNPNNITSATDTAVTVSKIYRAYVSGSALQLDTGVANAGYTTINPGQYNNSGTLASVGASDASIQRVYWYPNSTSRAFTVYYGSATYADPPGGQNALDLAQQNIAAEPFTEGENTAGAAILVGYILVLGNATDLSDTAQARFIQAGISRGAGAGGGGGVAAGATTPGGLDTYVQFNDGGSTFGGDAGLTYNKTTDTLTITGDLAVNGGDLTTTAATFNLVTGSATTVNFAQSATAVAIGAAGGRTTVSHDLAVGTGNIIGAPGTGANVMTLLSSGNIVAKLDVDNDAVGHKFIVQDYTGASQFSVGENGSAELTGSLVVTGSVTALAGFSGSLTKLANGSDYLLPGSNVSLSTGSNGAITINSSLPTGFLAQSFGGGYDGSVTVVDGAILSLGNEVHYNSITIQGSGSIKPNGWRIFCKGTLTISASGSINDDGNVTSGSTGGTAFAARGLIGGTATAGANGVAISTNGTNASTINNCSRNDSGAYPSSAVGGSAGVRTGGTSAVCTSTFGTQQAHSCWQTGRPIWAGNSAASTSNPFSSGIGGNSGGNDVGAAVTSGAGGGAGGIVWVCANTISNSGRISANGAPGGNATGTPGVGGGGGGGGGSGGIVTVITTTPVSLIGGSITANGGAGGNGIGTGTSGSAGVTGCRVIVSYGGN